MKRFLWVGVALLCLFIAPVYPQGGCPPGQEPSACDNVCRPKGVGYTPPSGSLSCLFTGLNADGQQRCYPMDLSAHGFGENGRTYDYQQVLARYGPTFAVTDTTVPRNLALHAENLGNLGNPFMQRLCCTNTWGTAKTLSCYPWYEELVDFWAVNWHMAGGVIASVRGGGGAGGGAPGQPRITELSSPAPGVLSLKWQTRQGHSAFEIRAGDVLHRVAGDVFGATLELPAGVGGPVGVAVIAYMGATAGKPSLPKTVNVEPRPAAPVPPPVKPDPPVTPPPVDPPVTPPASPGAVCLEIPGQTGVRLRLVVVPAEECRP